MILVGSFRRIAARSTKSAPTPSAKEPAAKYSAAFVKFTPPVGISLVSGNGAFSALMCLGPRRYRKEKS